MNEKPTIAVTLGAEAVYIKLHDRGVVALYGTEAGPNYLVGEVTDFGYKPLTSLTSDELWEIVREVILERIEDEGH